ncbi:type 1 periplasmic binding fold superfamily protein [Winogradskyella sp. UBA3174]|uniref:type 1 periplasmic binding fold superfamily protein n=1 Tax=Winogradskyella sp. UBA3174 TaxID=1947785 RepID=UPI0025DD8720|nr:type 1 periplasmic binding fold superfamily protein [Winogradskyella sp. UBA3174]|tara:strand:- start:62470 stop:63045 length:576 start_codon:yes stop_codon:yes gene_type:complete
MKTYKTLSILAALAISFSSCSDDDNPDVVNEEEVITTVRFELSPITTGSSVVIQSQDLDGADGPDAPIITTMGTILASTQYTGSVQFLNEIDSPAEDVTLEVLEEADEHQVFYALTGSSGSTITYNDLDGNGNPIGVDFSFNSGVAGTDNTVIVTLRHEPSKDAEGVNEGLIANAGGETDIEVVFNFTVEN